MSRPLKSRRIMEAITRAATRSLHAHLTKWRVTGSNHLRLDFVRYLPGPSTATGTIIVSATPSDDIRRVVANSISCLRQSLNAAQPLPVPTAKPTPKEGKNR